MSKKAYAKGRERRAFEAWYKADVMPRLDWFKRDGGGDYVLDYVQDAWRGWKARAKWDGAIKAGGGVR